MLRYTIHSNINNSLDKWSFLPLEITSAMSRSASEIKDEVDSQIRNTVDSDSELYVETDGSFDIVGPGYIDYDLEYISRCSKDFIEKNINNAINGGQNAY